MSRGKVTMLAAAVVLFAVGLREARGQAAWEYEPYQVRCWISAHDDPRWTESLQQELSDALVRRADVAIGAVWNLTITSPPPAAQISDLAMLSDMPQESLKTFAGDALKQDKLIIVRLSPADGAWNIDARELDCRSRQWGPVMQGHAPQLESLPLVVWDVILDSFHPLVRIESVEGREVKARLRAGGLVSDPSSPALIEPGMVLRPILRRNDRSGEPAANTGIQPIPWTLLTVTERKESLLTCQSTSGFRAAIPARGGVRTERLALLVRPLHPSTRIVLQTRHDPPQPLAGYEVYLRRTPDAEAELLGATDWRGEIEVPRGNGTLVTLLVRNGNQLLARLPFVPGQDAVLAAPLADDEGRLQAEGAVAALHSRALDLVARREVLAARFRARLKEQKFDEAQKLLDEFRKLETRSDLSRALDEQQQRISATDRMTQTRIDKIFGEARKILLLKALSDDMVNTLAAELLKARTAPKTAPAAATPTAKAGNPGPPANTGKANPPPPASGKAQGSKTK